MHILRGCIIILSLLFCADYASAVTAAEMKLHLTNTFANYDTRVRPVSDQANVVELDLKFYFIGINNFDSSAQKLETTAYLEITWNDDVLQADWSNAAVTSILVPQTSVWLPDLALQNGFESLSGLGNSFQNVKITKSASACGITWKPFHVFESACTVDVSYFPFDKTTCDLKFVIWSNPVSLVKASSGSSAFDSSLYEQSSEWEILTTTSTNFQTTTTSGVTFSVEMKRKPLFYLLNILLPVIMLALLNAFVFVLPASSGEKTGFAVTAFLAFAVFLTIISAELPQNSEKISTFGAYLFLMTFISTLIVLITIAELRLFNRDDEQPIPGCLQGVTRCVRRIRCCCCRDDGGGYIRGLNMGEIKRRLADNVTWADAVDSVDFVLFWVFFIIISLVTILCCTIAALGALS